MHGKPCTILFECTWAHPVSCAVSASKMIYSAPLFLFSVHISENSYA